MWRTLFSTIEACGCSVKLSYRCLSCVEDCDGCLREPFAGFPKEDNDRICVGCGGGEFDVCKGVFEILYLRGGPGAHPDVVM